MVEPPAPIGHRERGRAIEETGQEPPWRRRPGRARIASDNVILLEGPPVAKTISVAQLGHGGASRAIRDAEDGAVLVSKENCPAAWIVSAARLARVAAARG